MKKLVVILIALSCLHPTLTSADAGGADAGLITCEIGICNCTYEAIPGYAFGPYVLPAGYWGVPTDSGSCLALCFKDSQLKHPGDDNPAHTTSTFSCNTAAVETPIPVKDPIFPELNVIIPGLGYIVKDGEPFWSEAQIDNVNGQQNSNLLGTYIAAIYGYALVAGSIVAVTMLMIAGLQYATARGDSKHVEQAKKRIGNAVAGIILLLLAYNIAFFIDPATTNFEALSFKHIDGIQLNTQVAGNEGAASIIGAVGTWENLSSPYKNIVVSAKRDGICEVADGLASPTGTLPNQGNHHWFDGGANGEFNKINALDWSAAWGTNIQAPFSGTVSYETGSVNTDRCGNRIRLKSSSGDQITICHVKDFLNKNNQVAPGQVQQGDVIGHVGGQCCSGESVPTGWVTECNISGSACDPNTAGSCACQTIEQAGNSTGPHVHITWDKGASNILSCLAKAVPETSDAETSDAETSE